VSGLPHPTESPRNRTRIAVITLAQTRDFPTAWSSLHTITQQLTEDRRRFILLNDPVDESLLSALVDLPWSETITPGRNLGVASGRNRLISRALEWGADLVVTIDDDVFAPSDYLDRMAARFDEHTSEDGTAPLAVATPVVLDYHAVAPSIHRSEEIHAVERGEVSAFRIDVATEDLLSAWRNLDPEPQRRAVHHMGVRRWRHHYFSALGDPASELRQSLKTVVNGTFGSGKPEPTELRRDGSAIQAATSGDGAPVPIDSAAGGVSAFSASTFEDIGLLEEAFTPFGYEDAEMGVRACRSGKRVALLPSEIVLHDLQSRHKVREPLIAAATRAKARAILLRRHGGGADDTASAVLESFVFGWAEAAMYKDREGGVAAGALAYAAGLLAGLFRELTVPLLAGGIDVVDESFIRLGPATTIFSSAEIHPNGIVPTAYSGSAPIQLRLRKVPVRGGLANNVAGRARVSYRLDSSGRLQVHLLSVEFPALFKLELDAELSGILVGEEHPDSLLTNTRLHHLNLQMTNFGVVDRFEETLAWVVGEPSHGRLLTMSRAWPGPLGAAMRQFLSPWSPRTRLVVRVRPSRPVSARDLMTLEGGSWHVRRKLGLKVRVTGVDVADDQRRTLEGRIA